MNDEGAPTWVEPLTELRDRAAAGRALAARFVAAPPGERAWIASRWPMGVVWEYPTPWRLACVRGEMGSPRERIVTSLVLNALDRREASREETLLLCVAYNAAGLAGMDADALFSEVAMALLPEAAHELRTFAARPPDDKTLSAFDLDAVGVPGGDVEIRPHWSSH
jgi:hypothetical protein